MFRVDLLIFGFALKVFLAIERDPMNVWSCMPHPFSVLRFVFYRILPPLQDRFSRLFAFHG